MTPEEYAATVRRRLKWPATGSTLPETRLAKIALGLAAEAGEFAGEVEKSWGRGKTLDAGVGARLILELGDVLFFVVAACEELGTALDAVCESNDAKLTARERESAPVQPAHEVVAVCPGCDLPTVGMRRASGQIEITRRCLHFVRVGADPLYGGCAVAVFDRYNRGGAHEIVEFSRKT